VVLGIVWGRVYEASGVTVGIDDRPEWNWLVGPTTSDGFVLSAPEIAPDFSAAAARRLSSVECGDKPSGTMSDLITSAVFMAIVGYLETVAVGGKFAMQARYHYHPNQELNALGLANLATAVSSGYPVTGSFSRTAVNAMLGATSQVSGMLTGFVVLIAVYVAMPLIEILPLAALAPIIVQGALGVISFGEYLHAYKVDPNECYIMILTTIVSLVLTVKEGLVVGFLCGILYTMYTLSHPNLVVLGKYQNQLRDIRNFRDAELQTNALFVRMDARLNYANSRKLREFINKACTVHQARVAQSDEQLAFVVLDCKSINEIDVSGVEALEQVADGLKSQGIRLCLANIKAPLMSRFNGTHFWSVLKEAGGHFSDNLEDVMRVIEGIDPKGEKCNEAIAKMLTNMENRQNERKAREKHTGPACTRPPC